MEFEKAKIIVGGDSGVGKTVLVHLLCNEETLPHPSYTIGCSLDIRLHFSKLDTNKQNPYFIELWDIGGSNMHANARSAFYQNIHGIILVYDCTNKKSEVNLKKWLQEILGNNLKKTDNCPIYGQQQQQQHPYNSHESLYPNPVQLSPHNNETSSSSSSSSNPPVLIVGTKFDLLNPRLSNALSRVTPRRGTATTNTSAVAGTNLFVATPRSCLSSVQVFDDSIMMAASDLTGNRHYGLDGSVHINLSHTRNSTLSSCDSPRFGADLNKSDVAGWNFAAEQGFSEILMNCNSLDAIRLNSMSDLVLNQFFDEVIQYKVALTSLSLNLSGDVSRYRRRINGSRNNLHVDHR